MEVNNKGKFNSLLEKAISSPSISQKSGKKTGSIGKKTRLRKTEGNPKK